MSKINKKCAGSLWMYPNGFPMLFSTRPIFRHLFIYWTILIKIRPDILLSLISVQIDEKSYHNMIFACNQIRFSRAWVHLTHIFLPNSYNVDKTCLFVELDQSSNCFIITIRCSHGTQACFIVSRHIFTSLNQGQVTHSATSSQGPNCLKRRCRCPIALIWTVIMMNLRNDIYY